MPDLRINSTRLKEDFAALSQIGGINNGSGVNRPALSDSHSDARLWFKQRSLASGFRFAVDGAGNHSAHLACGPMNASTTMVGSHLDTVFNGGKFDGALGVLAALEVLRVVKEQDIALPFNLEAIDFTDEEGTLVGLLGSSALAGTLTSHTLQKPRGGRQNLLSGLGRCGLTEEGLLNARRDPHTLSCYLELHIEQGPRLYTEGIDIGVVTGIVGINSYRISFTGEANHAGTTPMHARRDAAQGASAFTLAVREILLGDSFPDCAANVGEMHFSPGAFNIIPGLVELALELRAPDKGSLDRLESALLERAALEAQRFGLDSEIERLHSNNPIQMDSKIQDKFLQAAKKLGLSCQLMPSGAGHDAQSMAAVCPSGMIFIPSRGGISHSPDEYSRWEDCINGANTLLQTVLTFKS